MKPGVKLRHLAKVFWFSKRFFSMYHIKIQAYMYKIANIFFKSKIHKMMCVCERERELEQREKEREGGGWGRGGRP